MAEVRSAPPLRGLVSGFRWIQIAPLLAVLTLTAWAFASPVGASPDDDYHLVSTWCAFGGGDACAEVKDPNLRRVSVAFENAKCFALVSKQSAGCQDQYGLSLDGPTMNTDRGNFQNKYPDVYYGTMRVFAGDDLVQSALVMRLVNLALFVGLGTALAVLLPASRRQTLLWGWLISLVPLGMFLIPSNNPSGWAITGVGTAFMALLGWFESTGRRRWALGAMYIVGVVMAAGSRSDGAIYAAGATIVAALLTWQRGRKWLMRAALAAGGLAIAVLLFLTTNQADVGVDGITGSGCGSVPGAPVVAEPTAGLALAAYNLLQVPYLWTGAWGTWALGWFDTMLPAIVPWSAVAAFIVVGFAGLGLLNRRKAISIVGVVAVLVAFPVYLLTAGGDSVGSQFQPRYLLPLIVLLSLLLVIAPHGSMTVRFTRVQTFAILGALTIANAVSLQVNIRRYVTGADQQGLDLGAGAEWWWDGLAVGPMTVWVIGSVAFAGLLAVLWPELRRKAVAP